MKRDVNLINNSCIYARYPLYIKIAAIVIILLTGIWGCLLFFLWPGLYAVHPWLAWIVEALLVVPPLFYISMWALLTCALANVVHLSQFWLRLANRSLYSLFPMLCMVGRCIGISRESLSQSLIDGINRLVRQSLPMILPEGLLLLTPHCLQKDTCRHKVTHDVYNCQRCGQCQVGGLLQIAIDYGCQFVVVTGGTLARMKVKKAKPQAIIAIACERDLVSGMQDVFPVPVIGILNERPHGPCCNTRIDLEHVEKVVQELLYGTTKKKQ